MINYCSAASYGLGLATGPPDFVEVFVHPSAILFQAPDMTPAMLEGIRIYEEKSTHESKHEARSMFSDARRRATRRRPRVRLECTPSLHAIDATHGDASPALDRKADYETQ